MTFKTLFIHEYKTHSKYLLTWCLSIWAYILLTIAIYPGEEEANSLLNLFESNEIFEIFLGQIGGDAPAYRLWISLMMNFVSIAFFIFGLMLGVKVSASAISDETGELLHPQPIRRLTFLSIRLTFGLFGSLLLLTMISILFLIPFFGDSIPLENTISFLLLGLPYLFFALSIGLFLGPLAADNGRGYGFSLFLGLFLFGIQLIGNFYPDETELLTKWNPINWFNPSSIIITSDPTYENLIQNDEIIKLIISSLIFLFAAFLTFIKRDIIKEAAIPIPFITYIQRRTNKNNTGKSDKDRILTKWAGLLENKLPFTADFIYSDRRALLISTWAIIIFYSQILGFNTFSEAELQNIVQGFGSSGIINAFTYGENLTNDVYLWFIITQAIGLHWIIYLPLSAHWIKKVILSDSENLNVEILASLPISSKNVLLQKFLAILLELLFLTIITLIWFFGGEATIGVSDNQFWKFIAIIGLIPLYLTITSLGIVTAILIDNGVKYARQSIIIIALWLIVGSLLDLNKGLIGLYNPILLIRDQSINVANNGLLWLTVLSFIGIIISLLISNKFQWLKIIIEDEQK
jgi:ABC-type transport system involved in multi-copper enzyme maturation permease subunit